MVFVAPSGLAWRPPAGSWGPRPVAGTALLHKHDFAQPGGERIFIIDQDVAIAREGQGAADVLRSDRRVAVAGDAHLSVGGVESPLEREVPVPGDRYRHRRRSFLPEEEAGVGAARQRTE